MREVDGGDSKSVEREDEERERGWGGGERGGSAKAVMLSTSHDKKRERGWKHYNCYAYQNFSFNS